MKNLPSSIFLFLKIFLFLLPLITSQFDDPSLSKLIACMSVLHEEFKSKEPDQSISSAMMLKCFMTISDSQSRSFLLGLETGKNTLSKSEIKKLLDYESLKDMSPNVLKSKSNELDRALKKFRKIQEDYMGGREPEGDEDNDDEDYEVEDNYSSHDEVDDEVEGPDDDDINEDNYSTMMDLGGDDEDEEAAGLIDFADE